MTTSISIKLFIFQLIALSAFGQDSVNEIKLTQVPWTLSIRSMPQLHFSTQQDTLLPNHIYEELSLEKDKYNSCYIQVTPPMPRSSKIRCYENPLNFLKQVAEAEFTENGIEIKSIDSASSFETINSVRFEMGYYLFKPGKDSALYWNLLLGKYERHCIYIFVSYDNANLEFGEYLLEILRNSKFGKD